MNAAGRARAAWVRERIRENCFAPTNGSLTFGAELELLAFDATSNCIASVLPDEGRPGTQALAVAAATRLHWTETRSDKGVSRFLADGGGSFTFEPGGQLEYASCVHHSVDAVARELCVVESVLRDCASALGLRLEAVGVDPYNAANAAPLQLLASRYARMSAYFSTIGPDGARMMRQTASVQVNIGGIPVVERWASANAITPWLVGLFANSPRYAGAETGHASYRAHTWRGVDPTRTGIFAGADPVSDYAEFALAARAFLLDDAAAPFADLDDAVITSAGLASHLTTLFPEVRPRRYFEFRSLDALDFERRELAIAFIVGLTADTTASRDALELVGPADAALLAAAGRFGASEPRIAHFAGDLARIAAGGCRRLGVRVVSEELTCRLADLR